MKSLNIIVGLIFGIFLITTASAISASWGQWQGGSTNLVINQGENASFNYYFYTTSSSMTVSAKLYGSSRDLIYTFFDTPISNSYDYNSMPVVITPQIYQNPGSYYLTFYSDDASNSPSVQTIYLTVNPSHTPPVNSPPEIKPILNQTVNESSNYSYQVNATDHDGDALTYSLPSNPLNFSINSTGFISGIAPNVTADTNYSITILVSDGVYNVSQSYTLTVLNLQNQTNQTFPLSINFIPPTPGNGYYLQQNYIPIAVKVTNGTTLTGVSIYLYNATGYLIQNQSVLNSNFSYTFSNLQLGTYYINATATDSAGNIATIQTVVNLQTSSPPAPIQASSPAPINSYTYQDVYANQYQSQLGKTNPGIIISSPKQSSSLGDSLFIFLVIFLIVLIAAVLALIISSKRLMSKKVSQY